jgi:hypothetical protein
MEQTETITQPTTQSTTNQTVIPSIVPENTNVQPEVVKDLVSKVSEFKKNKATTATTQENFFDYKEIEKITDPNARKFAEDAYKSMQSGFTKKTQEIAEQKRAFDQKLAEMQNWSPERIQRELLNNPQFLQAAQQVAQTQNPPNSGLTEEQFSALTPQEKAELAQVPTLKNEINQLKQVNYQTIVAQRDSQLQTRYPDYNPTQIDATIRDLAQMNPLDIREHVYKSLKHDEDVAAAYELGRQETRGLNQEKINAITSNGNSVASADGLPTREKGDTDQTYFMKLANFRLAQFKNRK